MRKVSDEAAACQLCILPSEQQNLNPASCFFSIPKKRGIELKQSAYVSIVHTEGPSSSKIMRKQVARARELLQLAGADPVFTVSAFTGEGIEDLIRFLREETDPRKAQ